MKNLFILCFVLFGFQSFANAQAPMDVNEVAFTSNPNSFVGKTIRIKNVSMVLVDGPATAAPGVKPCSASNPMMKIVKVEFANPNFKACFEIPATMTNNIPKNLECIGNLTFKVSGGGMNHVITDCKVQP